MMDLSVGNSVVIGALRVERSIMQDVASIQNVKVHGAKF